jgi:chromosome segregation ATPase
MFTFKARADMSTPISIRLSDEVRDEFKALSEQSGMKQEDFITTLIATYKERQTQTDTGSPVFREKQKVDQSLAQIQRVVVGFLEIAHNDKEVSITKAAEQVATARDEVTNLKELLNKSKDQQAEILLQKTELEEKVSALEGQAQSLQVLQEAWREKETSLNARLADLDAEAKEARKLKSELAEAAAEAMKQKNIVALAEQKASTDKEALVDIKTRLQNMENLLEKSRTDLQTAKDTANKELVVLTQKHAESKGKLTAQIEFQTQKITELVALTQKHTEEKGNLTTKIDFQTQKIAELENQLVEKKKTSEPK